MRIPAVMAATLALAACNTNLGTGPSGPTPSPSASPSLLLVADSANNAVFVFPKKATGTESPLRSITSATLINPSPIAADPAGHIWVASHGSPPAILEFSAFDSGNVTPLATMYAQARTIPGTLDVSGLIFDSTGKLYVSTGTSNHILVYSAAVTGSPLPVQDISGANTTLNDAEGIALDAGGNIYVASRGSSAILEFAAGADGNTAPVRTIQGFFNTRLSSPGYVAVDAAGDVFALNANDTITEYAPGASGDVAPTATIGRTAIGTQMVFDAAGNLYLGARNMSGGGPVVLPPPISPVPSQVLTSPAFSAPTGIFAR